MSATVALAELVAALLASALVSAAFRQWALGHALLDVPNARSSHAQPVPRGGGVGIVLGFLVGLGVWIAAGGIVSPRALGWLAGALLVAVVSFADDLRSLPARVRLAVHLVGSLLLALGGAQGGDVPLLVALPLAFVWVTVFTNIYNFMDGIDGLAASQAIVAGMAYACAGEVVDNPLVTAAGLSVAAASGGFLLHNLPPARLFMGDVGSTFLGFTFAALPLLANLGVGGGRLPLAFGVAVLAPFLFDSLVTLTRRVLRGERWYEAHRTHFYQRLVRSGSPHGRVTAVYVVLAVWSAACALASLFAPGALEWVAVAAAYLPMLGVVWLARCAEPVGA